MERMTKIGMYGVALIMLAACGKGIPGYDATGTFEATEVTKYITSVTIIRRIFWIL